MGAGATSATAGFFVVAQGFAEARAGAAEDPLPEVDLAAGATSAAAGVGVCTAAPVEGRAEVAEGPLPEVVLAAGAAWAAAGVGVCTAEPVEAFAEAAETRAVSAAVEEPCIAAAGAHFAVAAQAVVPASAVGSDGRHRVSLPRDAAADRRERGEDLTRTDVRFAVEELDFME